MAEKRVVITHAKRTPIGKFMGMFTEVTAVELGVVAVKAILNESGVDPGKVNEVIFGNARQAGNRPNPARQIGCFAGLPDTVPAYTVNKACGSALKSIMLAYQAIVLGDADIIIAGGTENMTRTPFMFEKMRWGYRLGHAPLIDGMYQDGFLCPMSNLTMGQTAEKLNEEYKISREEQDKFALRSNQLSIKATEEGLFKAEIAPVTIKDKKGDQLIEKDEGPRADTNMEKLAKLPAQFSKNGTVTPGNACQISDGASAVLVMSEEQANKLGFEPLAFVGKYSVVAIDPSIMGIAPVPAVQQLLEKTGGKFEEFDLVEINEAFAAQVLACDKELHFNWDRTNVNGGSIALGHPIGATGARFVTTLLHAMKRRNAKNGLATLCHSGGMGIAVQFNRD
ncbi:MAG: thiolase family protein [Planctomycetota bacterium]